ncbi:MULTISPECIES: hypothetical protein [Streptomyces]|uniref:Uncharacterized protein n=2 Tax=Streptomyces TaxID=1883 RepID=A0A939FKV2_9ACTN|nr:MULTISPECIES: hypothetical protein [Streptomyces]MBO0653132.1 hypothetical protein [Streptomyces triculaminicus]QSY48033.1 hypothetical protein J3S04_22825 [Streptomyces griseocarneus]
MGEREVGHEEFLAPGRDETQARVVHRALRHLADGSAGEVLREMAREVLSGRLGLDEAVRVGAYAEALGERTRPLREAWERGAPRGPQDPEATPPGGR